MSTTVIYWVNPANTAHIVPVLSPSAGFAPPNGDPHITPVDGPDASNNLWPEGVRTDNPPATKAEWYFQQEPAYTFTGSAVDVLIAYAQMSIDEVHGRKSGQLDEISVQVLHQGVDVALPSNGTQGMRSDVDSHTQYLHTAGTTLPQNTNHTAVDVWRRFYRFTPSDCPTIRTQMSLHITTALANTEVHRDEIDRLRDIPDWDALTDYDLSTGWPAPPMAPMGFEQQPPPAATVLGIDPASVPVFKLDILLRALEHNDVQTEPKAQFPDGSLNITYVWRFLLRNLDSPSAPDLLNRWRTEHPQP